MSAAKSSRAALPVRAGRIAEAFARARKQGRAALICYAMGGDPTIAATEELLLALDEAGADLLELGIPFSDPIADGPVLQASANRALRGGTSLPKLIELAARLRGKLRAPLLTMGYANPFFSYGVEKFAADAGAAGIAGAIIPDVPLEEAGELSAALGARGLDLVPLCAPTTGPKRLAAIAASARGFLYYVSVTGVTGAREALPEEIIARLAALRAISPVPVAVGFGIARPEQAAALAPHADGIVVGSALVSAHHEKGLSATAQLARSLRTALDAAARP